MPDPNYRNLAVRAAASSCRGNNPQTYAVAEALRGLTYALLHVGDLLTAAGAGETAHDGVVATNNGERTFDV